MIPIYELRGEDRYRRHNADDRDDERTLCGEPTDGMAAALRLTGQVKFPSGAHVDPCIGCEKAAIGRAGGGISPIPSPV